MRVPTPCNHVGSITKLDSARWVYGTPGIIPARYRCDDCSMEWDDPTETPESSHAWSNERGPEGMYPS